FPRAVFMSFGAFLSYHRYADHLALHSSPTRRSSDLGTRRRARQGPGTRDRVRRAVRPVEGPPPARGDAGAAGRVRGRPPAPRLTRARAGPDPRAVATATAADTSREGGRQAPAACLDEAAQWPAGRTGQRGRPTSGSQWLQQRCGVTSGAPPGAG